MRSNLGTARARGTVRHGVHCHDHGVRRQHRSGESPGRQRLVDLRQFRRSRGLLAANGGRGMGWPATRRRIRMRESPTIRRAQVPAWPHSSPGRPYGPPLTSHWMPNRSRSRHRYAPAQARSTCRCTSRRSPSCSICRASPMPANTSTWMRPPSRRCSTAESHGGTMPSSRRRTPDSAFPICRSPSCIAPTNRAPRSISSNTSRRLRRADWPYELSENWPNDVGQGAKGTSGVISTIDQANGTIGYADFSQAGGMGTVAVQVGDTPTVISAEAASKAVADSTLDKSVPGKHRVVLDITIRPA